MIPNGLGGGYRLDEARESRSVQAALAEVFVQNPHQLGDRNWVAIQFLVLGIHHLFAAHSDQTCTGNRNKPIGRFARETVLRLADDGMQGHIRSKGERQRCLQERARRFQQVDARRKPILQFGLEQLGIVATSSACTATPSGAGSTKAEPRRPTGRRAQAEPWWGVPMNTTRVTAAEGRKKK